MAHIWIVVALSLASCSGGSLINSQLARKAARKQNWRRDETRRENVTRCPAERNDSDDSYDDVELV